MEASEMYKDFTREQLYEIIDARENYIENNIHYKEPKELGYPYYMASDGQIYNLEQAELDRKRRINNGNTQSKSN